MLKSHYLRLLVAIGLLASRQVRAIEAGIGASMLDQGDDRLVPALSVKYAPAKEWVGYAHYHGVNFGPAHMDVFIASGARRFNLDKSGYFSTHFGASLLFEQVVLDYDEPGDKSYNDTDRSGNIGGNFGVAVGLPPGSSPVDCSVTWDSHVFPAGFGGLFLANGRKQTITITLGANL